MIVSTDGAAVTKEFSLLGLFCGWLLQVWLDSCWDSSCWLSEEAIQTSCRNPQTGPAISAQSRSQASSVRRWCRKPPHVKLLPAGWTDANAHVPPWGSWGVVMAHLHMCSQHSCGVNTVCPGSSCVFGTVADALASATNERLLFVSVLHIPRIKYPPSSDSL